MKRSEVRPAMRPFRPYGAARELWTYRGREMILSGSAGTGKSRGCLEKVHACAERWPGSRILVCRKTRRSLTETALVTFEDKVLPQGHPALRGPKRSHRQTYLYPGGTEVIIAGLDDLTKIMSGEYDLIFVQEAIEVDLDDWEKLLTRLRNGVMPFQQIIGDTNPDAPTHWINQRANAGVLKMLESRHEDNPSLYNPDTEEWTEAGRNYLEILDALTGVRRDRLRYGKWVQAEGLVWDGWNRARHVIPRFEIPAEWPRYWSLDFGYKNPFVWQAWAEDPDGVLYCYREIYRTKRLVEDHTAEILRETATEPRPVMVIADHDAEDRATFERKARLVTTAAEKSVSEGIQSVASALKFGADKRAGIYFLEDSLVERDADLAARKLPCSTIEELDGYVWDERQGRRRGEEPLKLNDHGCDTMRYLVNTKNQARRPLTADSIMTA